MKKLLLALLILFLILLAPVKSQEVTKEDFLKYIPKDYDKLLEAYKQMVEFAFKWKELYEKESEINKQLIQKLEILTTKLDEMNKSIQRLEKTVDILYNIINIFAKPKIGLNGGINLKDGGFYVGASINF